MSGELKSLEAHEALDILQKHLLGEDWYVVDPIHTGQVNAVIVDEIIGRYKGITETPVNKWRRKHKRCEFCQYYDPNPDVFYAVLCNGWCKAKMKSIKSGTTPRPFCRTFKLKRYREEIK